MEKINYLEIFKKAWRITWNHKYLWWLGVLAGSGSSLSFNFPFDLEKEAAQNNWEDKISSFAESHLALILGAIVLIIAVWIILELLKILAYSGLIRSFLSIEKNEKKNVKELLQEGGKYFARILKIKILLALVVLALLLILIVPVGFLFAIKSFVFGGLATLLAFVILLPALVGVSFISHYGSLYVITSDLTVRDALEQGYKIFAKNIWPSILMSLLFVPVNILASFAFMLPFIVIAVPVAILGFVFYQLFSATGIWIIGTFAGLLLLGLLLLFRSVLSVFTNSAWLLFFQSIATAKKEEVEIKEGLVVKSEIQPEKA